MFYILIILGTCFIVVGVLSKQKYTGLGKKDILIEEEKGKISKDSKISEKNDTRLLEKRIDILEELLFKQTLEEETTKQVVLSEKIEGDSLEKYKLIDKYEKENKSIDEIAKLLSTNKGEVLLLKSLYKNL